MVKHNLKPVYERKGKIDTYKHAPVYDKETHRIQMEIWSIKEQIKLTTARLAEEERVIQIQQQAEERMGKAAVYRNRAKQLEVELQASQRANQQVEEKLKVAQEQHAAELQATRLDASQRMAKMAQDYKDSQARLQQKTEAQLERIQAEYNAAMQALRTETTQRLTEKEQEMDQLTSDIRGLLQNLQQKRKQLGETNAVVASLETELHDKESVLVSLERERASLRAMTKQGWKVLKTRVKKRLGGEEGNVVVEPVVPLDDANDDVDKSTEMVPVGKRKHSTS